MDVLRQVANCLPKRKHCVQLAHSLGLADEFLNGMREETFTSEVTLNVLHVWKQKKSERATGKVLFDALIAMNKRDVALRFGEELLGQGEAKLFFFVCVCTHVCVCDFEIPQSSGQVSSVREPP